MKKFASQTKFSITAPGRICLFGDHQDYLGLPVIACAINKCLNLSVEKNKGEFFHILMPDIATERYIPIHEISEILVPQDYFASGLRVVRRYGCIPTRGYNITIESTIPINAGVSSSSALVVAWVHFLLKAFGCDQPITPDLIAQLAYEAEVVEHQSPGGRMDQYTSAIGNIIYINTAVDLDYQIIGDNIPGLILAESGVPKATLDLLSYVRHNASKAIEIVSKMDAEFELGRATIKDYERAVTYLSEDLQPFLYAAIKNHMITQKAFVEFKNEKVDLEIIGNLMSYHHLILKDVLEITVPKIDAMIDAALDAGAFGAKIVGSGGGGSIVALSPRNKKEEIINAILETGAKAAYEVSVGKGSQIR